MPSRGSATPSDCGNGGGGGVSGQMADTTRAAGCWVLPSFWTKFGLPVFVRWRCADVVPVGLQLDVSVVTAILNIATLLLWSSAATATVT